MKETKDYVNNEVEHINATVNTLTLRRMKYFETNTKLIEGKTLKLRLQNQQNKTLTWTLTVYSQLNKTSPQIKTPDASPQ